MRKRTLQALLTAVSLLLFSCRNESIDRFPAGVTGDPRRGAELIRAAGCGSCHAIPGIRGAGGTVGPPLDFWSRRAYIAGRIPNTPENLEHWIRNPSAVDPKTAMPDTGLNPTETRDVVAYLYTLD